MSYKFSHLKKEAPEIIMQCAWLLTFSYILINVIKIIYFLITFLHDLSAVTLALGTVSTELAEKPPPQIFKTPNITNSKVWI